MWRHRHSITPRPPFLAVLLVAVLAAALALPRSSAAEVPDDGCDPSEPVACIPLPIEGDEEGGEPPDEGDAMAAAAGRAPSVPPRPCPPFVVPATAEAAAAVPAGPGRGCMVRDIVAAVNRANVLYARALRNLDTGELPAAWGGEALAELQRQVAGLRDSGRYATPQMLSISLQEVHPGAGTARVRTIENWIYQERAWFSGEVLVEQNQWVENNYHLQYRGAWIVMQDFITLVSPPVPPPPPPPLPPATAVSVTTDRGAYALGETVFITITNHSGEMISAGRAYLCRFVLLERQGASGWENIADPAGICTADAAILRPGSSRTEQIPAGPDPGTYRIVFRYSSERSNAPGVAYSAPFTVR